MCVPVDRPACDIFLFFALFCKDKNLVTLCLPWLLGVQQFAWKDTPPPATRSEHNCTFRQFFPYVYEGQQIHGSIGTLSLQFLIDKPINSLCSEDQWLHGAMDSNHERAFCGVGVGHFLTKHTSWHLCNLLAECFGLLSLPPHLHKFVQFGSIWGFGFIA